MSELPNTRLDTDQNIPKTVTDSQEFVHYFGYIDRQTAISGVAAYVEGTADLYEPDDRNVTTAWLLNNVETVAMYIPDERSRNAKLHGALMRASTEMWAHFQMQKHRDLRPRRLKGLDQAEIPTR